jgi:DNA-binding beta-propeller fold protein YncE
MQNPKSNFCSKALRGVAISASALALAGVLAGCGGALSSLGGSDGSGSTVVHFSGNVHGGQQPVAGATVQLYTVGTTGLKSASTALIGTSVVSDAGGNFNITGKYNCATLPATQVYIVATGGNPGAGTNSALSMMTALGPCTSLTPSTFIQINELTTVAAAYALAPFAQDYTHVGASGFNPTGLVNAFASASNLVNFGTGSTPGSTLPAGATEPVAELDTLANILAACVNTTGAASTQCTTLFTATGATETIGAALAIAKNPGLSSLTALYTLSNGQAPFQPTLSGQPNDFTVAVNYNAGGTFASPYGIALDATGNAWITNEGGTTVTELGSSGSVLLTANGTGTVGTLYGPQGIAIDPSGNIWVANTAGNSVVRYTLGGGLIITTLSFTTGITAPTAIALDAQGNAFVANFNGNSVAKLNNAGAPAAGSPFTASGAITLPSGIALDTGGNVLVTSSNGSVVKLGNDGTFIATETDSTLQGPLGVALDANNRVFMTGSTTGATLSGAVSEFSAAGAASPVSPVQSGVGSPFGVATDGVSAWVANSSASGSLSQLQYGSATPLSPAAGFGSLNTPVGVAVDASGSVWTANSGSNTVSKFIGLAMPVATPLSTTVGP